MIASPVFAAFPTLGNMNTLKGIKTVCVEANVIWVAEQASKYRVTSSSLKSRVEGKLKEAGIRVAPLDECKGLPGSPYLQVTAIVVPFPGLKDNLNVTISFDYLQNIVLVRDKKNKSSVPTWSIETTSVPRKKSLLEGVMGTVDHLVEEFAEDFFFVNRDPPLGRPANRFR
jgi:hypothetical protein